MATVGDGIAQDLDSVITQGIILQVQDLDATLPTRDLLGDGLASHPSHLVGSQLQDPGLLGYLTQDLGGPNGL